MQCVCFAAFVKVRFASLSESATTKEKKKITHSTWENINALHISHLIFYEGDDISNLSHLPYGISFGSTDMYSV